MQKVEIALADELAESLRGYQDRLPELLRLGLQQLRINDALLLYSRGLVSVARAAELAGIDREAMVRQARAAGAEPLWSEEMVGDELA